MSKDLLELSEAVLILLNWLFSKLVLMGSGGMGFSGFLNSSKFFSMGSGGKVICSGFFGKNSTKLFLIFSISFVMITGIVCVFASVSSKHGTCGLVVSSGRFSTFL